jgi:hypothetical protein
MPLRSEGLIVAVFDVSTTASKFAADISRSPLNSRRRRRAPRIKMPPEPAPLPPATLKTDDLVKDWRNYRIGFIEATPAGQANAELKQKIRVF